MKRIVAVAMMALMAGCTGLTYDYAPYGQIMGSGPTDPEKAQEEAIKELIRVGGEFGIVRTSYGLISPGLKHISVYSCQPGEFPNRCKRVDRAVASSSPLLLWWGSAALVAWGLRGTGDQTQVEGGAATAGSASSAKALSNAEAEARAKAFMKRDRRIHFKDKD